MTQNVSSDSVKSNSSVNNNQINNKSGKKEVELKNSSLNNSASASYLSITQYNISISNNDDNSNQQSNVDFDNKDKKVTKSKCEKFVALVFTAGSPVDALHLFEDLLINKAHWSRDELRYDITLTLSVLAIGFISLALMHYYIFRNLNTLSAKRVLKYFLLSITPAVLTFVDAKGNGSIVLNIFIVVADLCAAAINLIEDHGLDNLFKEQKNI